jgi:NAD+ kinase
VAVNVIGIITKPYLLQLRDVVKKLVAWLREQNRKVLLDGKTAELIGEPSSSQPGQLATQADMIVVLGGDGTMLSAARLVEQRGVPILGVNMGGLGFLTETTQDDLYPSLARVFANDFILEERLMLLGRLQRHGAIVGQSTVLNDVVVSKGALSRMIEVQITVSGQFVTKLRGDGLIISTPTGSTAYSLGAGGPIVNPSVQALVVTPISPHTLTHRPLLVPSSGLLEVELTSKDEGAMTTFDGQVGIATISGDRVEISASEHRTRLIRFPDRTYYDVLRRKLKWGDG